MTRLVVIDINVPVDVIDDLPHHAGEIIAASNFMVRKLMKINALRRILIQDLDRFNNDQGLTPARGRGRNPDNS